MMQSGLKSATLFARLGISISTRYPFGTESGVAATFQQ
jgi:hypothetical protein